MATGLISYKAQRSAQQLCWSPGWAWVRGRLGLALGAGGLQVREKASNRQKEWVGGADWRLLPARRMRGSGAQLQTFSLPGLFRCPCSPGWSSVRVSGPSWGLGTWRKEFEISRSLEVGTARSWPETVLLLCDSDHGREEIAPGPGSEGMGSSPSSAIGQVTWSTSWSPGPRFPHLHTRCWVHLGVMLQLRTPCSLVFLYLPSCKS